MTLLAESGLVGGILMGMAVAIGGAIYFGLRAWRAYRLPVETLERVRRYMHWMEMDVVERDAKKASMSADDREQLREAESEYWRWKDKLPASIAELDKTIAKRRATT